MAARATTPAERDMSCSPAEDDDEQAMADAEAAWAALDSLPLGFGDLDAAE